MIVQDLSRINLESIFDSENILNNKYHARKEKKSDSSGGAEERG